MDIRCVWEHNGRDTLLYASDFPGAFARGEDLTTARRKMPNEISSYLQWATGTCVEDANVNVIQESECDLNVYDADSDVIFHTEREPLQLGQYEALRALTLKSASDFLTLYQSIPDKNHSDLPQRTTFYGVVPRTAEEMYQHTKNVNAYYFGEIGVDADNEGDILSCRLRGFDLLEQQDSFLLNTMFEGSYGECWTLRKMLRRFIWHDRIHAKAMYRMATRVFGAENIVNPFFFED